MGRDGGFIIGKGRNVEEPPKPLLPVIPVIFVPGVMGSNLKVMTEFIPKVKQIFIEEGREEDFTDKAWHPPNVTHSKRVMAKHFTAWRRDNDTTRMGKLWEGYGPKIRQALLNPETTEVDEEGLIPELGTLSSAWGKDGRAEARRRRWGSVHWETYGGFLRNLEAALNRGKAFGTVPDQYQDLPFAPEMSMGHAWLPKAILPTMEELKHAHPFLLPVFAFGYNWTQSNGQSAKELLEAAARWIGEYQEAGHDCKQAILVTHSMGGLVARAASKLDEKGLILGVVHGVMPAIGAPVLYRNVVMGWEAEDEPLFFPKTRGVIIPLAGRTSAETTPVVGNAPGVLELLPSHLYPKGWLKIQKEHWSGKDETLFELPENGDPYEEIYKQKDVWWRLIDVELLDPAGFHSINKTGANSALAWDKYLKRMDAVQKFHLKHAMETSYHDKDRTYIFYGSGKKTYSTVRWLLQKECKLFWSEIRSCLGQTGRSSICRLILRPSKVPKSHRRFGEGPYELIEPAVIKSRDGDGDETVPSESGSAPGKRISNIFKLKGFKHASAFDDMTARVFTILAICKLAKHSDGKVRSK